MNLTAKEKKKIYKILFFSITSIVALTIVAFTVGREIYEGKSENIVSFGLVHFSGYLFFLLMPVEMAFVYYLSYYKEIELVGIALGTAFTAQLIDYFIGYSFSSKFIHNFVGENRIAKSEKYIHKYGNITILIFNLFPLSSPVIALVAGMLKYSIKDLILFSVIGLTLKYIILCMIF